MKISFSLFLRLLLPSLPPEGYNGPMKMLEIKIEEAMAGRTVRSVLLREGRMAASHLSSLKFREGGLLLNGQRARSSDVLRPGDILAARIDDGRGENPAQPMEAPLDFVWEDEYLAVLNKAAGMAVHGSLQGGACTVANALAARWGREQTFHPVNRLDRGTSGLMLIATLIHGIMPYKPANATISAMITPVKSNERNDSNADLSIPTKMPQLTPISNDSANHANRHMPNPDTPLNNPAKTAINGLTVATPPPMVRALPKIATHNHGRVDALPLCCIFTDSRVSNNPTINADAVTASLAGVYDSVPRIPVHIQEKNSNTVTMSIT